MMILDGPILITTTRNIRKKKPIRCNKGDEAAHLVGLNLAKLLFNYYSTERDVVISEIVISQLIKDINDESNLACETKEANTDDKYTEQELKDLLFHGSLAYKEMSQAAKTMLERLQYLLGTMLRHLDQPSPELQLIYDEIKGAMFPLPRHCKKCALQCFMTESSSFNVFCDVQCQRLFYEK